MAGLRSRFEQFSSVGYRSSLSSYSASLVKKINSAQDDAIDDAYKRGEMSTESYVLSLNERLSREYLTPLQRTNLTQKIRDVQIDAEDAKIQSAYETGGTYQGQKVDDQFLLAWEQTKLENMNPESEEYNNQQVRVSNLQDRVDKQERSNFRRQRELEISQQPDNSLLNLQSKLELYDELIDMAERDGDIEQSEQYQITRNNVAQSLENAKASKARSDELNRINQESFDALQDEKYGSGKVTARTDFTESDLMELESAEKDNTENFVEMGQWGEAYASILNTFSENGEDLISDKVAQDLNKDLTSLDKDASKVQQRQIEINKIVDSINALVELRDEAKQAGLDDRVSQLDGDINNFTNRLQQAQNQQDELVDSLNSKTETVKQKIAQAELDSLDSFLARVKEGSRLSHERLQKDFANGELMTSGISAKYGAEDPKLKYIEENRLFNELNEGVFDTFLLKARESGDQSKILTYENSRDKHALDREKFEYYQRNPETVDFFAKDGLDGGVIEFDEIAKRGSGRYADGSSLVDSEGTRFIDKGTVQLGEAGIRYELKFKDANSKEFDWSKIKFAPKASLTELQEAGNLNATIDIKLPGADKPTTDIPFKAQTDENGSLRFVPDKEKLAPWENRQEYKPTIKEKLNFYMDAIKDAFVDKQDDVQRLASTLTGNVPEAQALTIKEDFVPQGTTRRLSEEENTQFQNELRDRFGVDASRKQQPQTFREETTTELLVPEEYKQMILDTANKYGLRPAFLASVIRHESNFDPNAKNTSNADGSYDRGLAQLNSTYFPDDSLAYDPAYAIDKAGEILKRNLDATGSEEGALGAYNRGLAGYQANPALAQDYINMVQGKEPLVSRQTTKQVPNQPAFEPTRESSPGFVDATGMSKGSTESRPSIRSLFNTTAYAKEPELRSQNTRVGFDPSSFSNFTGKASDSLERGVVKTADFLQKGTANVLKNAGLGTGQVLPGKIKYTNDYGVTENLNRRLQSGIENTSDYLQQGTANVLKSIGLGSGEVTPGKIKYTNDYGVTEALSDKASNLYDSAKRKTKDLFGSLRSWF